MAVNVKPDFKFRINWSAICNSLRKLWQLDVSRKTGVEPATGKRHHVFCSVLLVCMHCRYDSVFRFTRTSFWIDFAVFLTGSPAKVEMLAKEVGNSRVLKQSASLTQYEQMALQEHGKELSERDNVCWIRSCLTLHKKNNLQWTNVLTKTLEKQPAAWICFMCIYNQNLC